MKKNRNPPKWAVERFIKNRTLEIPFDFQSQANNQSKLRIYAKAQT